jgi:hypothetical protein
MDSGNPEARENIKRSVRERGVSLGLGKMGGSSFIVRFER